jgi:ATP phosphoribosyltransferase
VYLTIPIKFSLEDDGEDSAQDRLSKSDLKQIKKDGKEICDIMYKLIEAKRAGDQVKIEKLISELDAKLEAQHKYYSEVGARSKELEKIVEPCMEEATKAALEK